MYDSWGDGWNGSTFTISTSLGVVAWSGTLNAGASGSASFAIGGGSCGGGNPDCGYTITVGGSFWNAEISWNLTDENGTSVASGFAPATVSACLPPGCYTMLLYDSYGDGWDSGTFTITNPGGTIISSGTLPGGSFGSVSIDVGGGNCGGGGGGDCSYTMVVGGGFYDYEISWSITDDMGANIGSGLAPASQTLCLETGCYTVNMFDAFGDGWNNANWAVYDNLGNTLSSGTLLTGGSGTAVFSVGGADCGVPEIVTASDCIDAVNVCTDLDFAIDPNGYGNIMEIPPLGSLANPDYGLGVYNPWGTTNWGCLRSNELNSTWMIVNISGSGSLEFTFGGLGMQMGFYDWIMYPYDENTCQDIYYNQIAPLRCNWNGASWGGTGLASVLPPGGDPTNFEPPLNVFAGEQYLICFSNWSSVSTTVPLQFGGTAIVSCEPLLLPVSLLDFSATSSDQSIAITWTTASEINNDKFVIERSNDLEHWSRIAEIQGAGNSQDLLHYEVWDKNPGNGWNYYRLKQYDYNGDHAGSGIVSAWFERYVQPVVLSNPNQGKFQLRGVAASSLHTIELLNLNGAVSEISTEILENGQMQVEMAHPEAGIYVLKLHYLDGKNIGLRVVVAH
jgi:hypothetical protein